MKYNLSGCPNLDDSGQHLNPLGSRHDAPCNADVPVKSHSNGRKEPPKSRDVEDLSKGCIHLNSAPDAFSLSSPALRHASQSFT